MTKIKYIYLLLISALLFGACSKDDVPGGIEVSDDEIAISYSLKKYVQVVTSGKDLKSASETRAIDASTADEEKIDNIYILMVNSGWTDIKRYYTATANFTQGTWDADGKSVKIKMTQSEAGTRNVYLVANATGTLKTALDGVTTLAGLQAALLADSAPWSPNLSNATTKSILMSGNTLSHDFVTNRVLSAVTLIRAVAKVELNITLPAKHQSSTPADYQYNFVDFDKNTYVLENLTKTADKATTGWKPFTADGTTDKVSSYEMESDKVSKLKIVTYINETTNANSYIEIQLPYKDGGFLPPPEFGPETFILPRQGEIKRNHWYKYDVEL
mgnify:CR=1 FL=1